MPIIENLPDEINITKITELKLEGICFQKATRGIWPFKAKFNSTSFLIKENYLLTSAHNVAKSFRKVNYLEISPSRIGNNYHYGTTSLDIDYSKHLKIHPNYRMRNSITWSPFDVALIYIPNLNQSDNFNNLNRIPLIENINTVEIGETIYCAGYPDSGEHKGRHKMTLDISEIIDIKENYFSHNLDTNTGNSGSPIMIKRNNIFYAIGINSIKHKGTLISEEKLEWIERITSI